MPPPRSLRTYLVLTYALAVCVCIRSSALALSCDTITILNATGADCKGTRFPRTAIEEASHWAMCHTILGSTVGSKGSKGYPHEFHNKEGFHSLGSRCTRPYYEFPIFATGVYRGFGPGPDRVVIGSVNTGALTAVYCGAITHCGASSRGKFNECENIINI